MASWRERAHAVIDREYHEIRAAHQEFGRAITDAEILTMINRDYYPFGERAMLPYKAWLQAIREWKVKLGIPVVSKAKKRRCGCWYKDGVVTEACPAHKDAWQGMLL